MKVSIVHPYLPEASQKNKLRSTECLSTAYLSAALVSAGHSVVDINAELEELTIEKTFEKIVEHNDIKFVGISCKAQRTYKSALRLAKMLKERDEQIFICLGGVYATAASKEIIDNEASIDCVVIGEGENAIVEIVSNIEAGGGLNLILGVVYRKDGHVTSSPPRERIRDLNKVSWPLRRDLARIENLTGEKASVAYMVASRGCYAACSFCSIHQLYNERKIVWRDFSDVVDEISSIVTTYGITTFQFVDDLFVVPSRVGERRIQSFRNEVVKKDLNVRFHCEIRADAVKPSILSNLVEAGLWRLFIGAEAGSPTVLHRMSKACSVETNSKALNIIKQAIAEGANIDVLLGYIMFDPELTFEELCEQYYWVKESGFCRRDSLQGKLNIYWNTPVHHRLSKKGLIKDDFEFSERWVYSYEDSRVEQFENYIREYNEWFNNTRKDDFFSFMGKLTKTLNSNRIQDHTFQYFLVDQIRRYVLEKERAIWFGVFDSLLAIYQNNNVISHVVWDEIKGIAILQVNRLSSEIVHLQEIFQNLRFSNLNEFVSCVFNDSIEEYELVGSDYRIIKSKIIGDYFSYDHYQSSVYRLVDATNGKVNDGTTSISEEPEWIN